MHRHMDPQELQMSLHVFTQGVSSCPFFLADRNKQIHAQQLPLERHSINEAKTSSNNAPPDTTIQTQSPTAASASCSSCWILCSAFSFCEFSWASLAFKSITKKDKSICVYCVAQVSPSKMATVVAVWPSILLSLGELSCINIKNKPIVTDVE